MERKTWLILPLLLILVFLSQSLLPVSLTVDYQAIYIEPDSIVDTAYTLGTNIIISIKTNYTSVVDDIWGYQFVLTYNPLVLEGLEVVNGDLINNTKHPTVFNAGTFDNEVGRLSLTGACFLPINVTSGDGDDTLATVTFNVTGTGDTPITLELETKLVDQWGRAIIWAQTDLYNIGHGYFRNVDPPPIHDVAVVSGITNATALGPYKGRMVEVNAIVKNNGTVRERLDISIYWGYLTGDWLIYNEIVDLDSGVSHDISFVWNTIDTYGYGTKNVTVVVAEVWNTTITSNNQKVVDTVHVKIGGDVDGDGYVDRDDIMIFASQYSPPLGFSSYDPNLDFNNDGKVDHEDFMILIGNRGKSEGDP